MTTVILCCLLPAIHLQQNGKDSRKVFLKIPHNHIYIFKNLRIIETVNTYNNDSYAA